MPAALLALLPSWAQGWALKAAILVFGLVVIATMLLKARESGKAAERLKALIRHAEVENARKKVDRDMARASPAERDRMLERYYRD